MHRHSADVYFQITHLFLVSKGNPRSRKCRKKKLPFAPNRKDTISNHQEEELMDSSQFPQEYTQDAAAMTSSSSGRPPAPPAMEKRGAPRPHSREHPPLHFPRCNSSNTKFCYYNNYSLSQPRHFCKSCKRYWTEGGTLRNVPVGGGSRKNKRTPSRFPLASPSPPKKLLLANPAVQNPNLNPSFFEGHGLVNLSGLFHAGPFMAAPMERGGGGFDGNMQEGAGGDCCGYWMNGMIGGGGSI